ncbi:hypothetical protein ABZV61_39495 [Streptomyces sp900116325]|uniref:Uncharacterized protein n=1 Tax=Streptomyces sp. 900116325 TaxID=3154295 RepID=A0ABV2ULF2_9ACTN
MAVPVDGQVARPTFDGVAGVGKPEADGKVQRVVVDPAQQSPNRRFRGQGPLGGGSGSSRAPTCSSTWGGASAIHSPTARSDVAPANTAQAARVSTTSEPASRTSEETRLDAIDLEA